MFERYLLLLEGTYIEFENITLTHVFGILEADHFEWGLEEDRILQKIQLKVSCHLGHMIQQIEQKWYIYKERICCVKSRYVSKTWRKIMPSLSEH